MICFASAVQYPLEVLPAHFATKNVVFLPNPQYLHPTPILSVPGPMHHQLIPLAFKSTIKQKTHQISPQAHHISPHIAHCSYTPNYNNPARISCEYFVGLAYTEAELRTVESVWLARLGR